MRISHAVVVVAATAAVVAGCSSSSSTSAPATAAGAACDEATITPVITTAIGSDQSLRQVNGLMCKDGWAVVFPTVGPTDGSTDGEIDITLVFKDESGTWVEQDRSAVCGTLPTGDASPTYPSDAQVPQELWQGACQSN